MYDTTYPLWIDENSRKPELNEPEKFEPDSKNRWSSPLKGYFQSIKLEENLIDAYAKVLDAKTSTGESFQLTVELLRGSEGQQVHDVSIYL